MADPAPVHLHTATTDPEVANEALRQLYTGARMGTVGELSSFSYSQDVDGDSELNVGRLRFRGSIAGHMVLEDSFSVVLPRDGNVNWRIGDRSGTGPGLFLVQPGQNYYGEVDRLSVDSVNLGLPTLQETARTVYGRDDLDVAFDDPRPVSRAREQYWTATARVVQEALGDPVLASLPLLRADLRRRIVVATLETFLLTDDPRARRASVAEHQTGFRRAVEFLHGALSQPVTVEDVARHAGLSTVELVRAFRSHAGTTPGAYLRDLRLSAAHQDLVRGDPAAGDTVREIALRWAMAYPGDFARRHRQTYGEPPSRTLRR
jgi:AraC-like DNA-binding protein